MLSSQMWTRQCFSALGPPVGNVVRPHSDSTTKVNVPAILPILPSLGGILWVLTGLLGVGLSMLHPRGWRWWGGLLRSQWRGLTVLAGIGVVACAAWALRSGQTEPAGTMSFELPHANWPVFQGSIRRLGSDGRDGPLAGGVVWTARSEYSFLGAPAVAGDVIIAVGSSNDRARVFCWNAESGEELWSGAPADYRTTLSSPIVVGGRIYCGEGVHHTPQSRVICLDPKRGEEPVVWEVVTSSHVECTPVYSNGRIYVAAGDDGVYCVAAESSESAIETSVVSEIEPSEVVWHVPGERMPDAETALAVHEGCVYVGLGFKTPGLVVLDATTGEELKRVSLPHPCFAPPTLFADGLLCGLGPGTLVNAATAGPGECRLVELKTLETRWRLPLPSSMVQSAAAMNGAPVVISADGVVYRISEKGEIEQSWSAGSPVLAAPAVAGGAVYIVSNDGTLSGLDLKSFERKWSVRLGGPGEYIASPVVSNGRVYVGTPSGLMCVGRPPTR